MMHERNRPLTLAPILTLLCLTGLACVRPEAPPPPPDFRISLQDCQELLAGKAGQPRCELGSGKDFTLLLEPVGLEPGTGKPPVTASALLVFYPPGADARVIEGPVSLETAYVWRGALEAEEAWLGQEARLEVVSWSGTTPALSPDQPEGVQKLLKVLEGRADVRRQSVAFVWQRPPIDALPPDSEARQCWEGYDAQLHDDASVQRCQRAWESVSPVDPISGMRIGTRLGLTHRLRGEYAQASQIFAEVATQAQAAGAVSRARVALYNQADVLLRSGALLEADAVLERAVQLTRQAGDLYGQTSMLRKRSQILQRQGDYAEAEQTLRDTISTAHRLRHAELEAHARLDLSILAVQLGDSASALTELDAAAPFFQQLEQGLETGNPEAESKHPAPKHYEDLGKYYGTLGWARASALRHGAPGESAAAIEKECYAKALHYLRLLAPDSAEVLTHQLFVVSLYLEQGDLQEAARQLAQAVPDPRTQQNNADYRVLEGELRLARKEWKWALQDFQHVATLSVPNPDLGWAAAFGQARALFGLGRSGEGWQKLEHAMSLAETQARTVVPGLERGWFMGDREQIFRYAEQVRLDEGVPAQAFGVAERSRVLAAQAEATQARVTWLLEHDPAGLRQRQAELETLSASLEPEEGEALLTRVERRKREQARERVRIQLRSAETALAGWIERAGREGRGSEGRVTEDQRIEGVPFALETLQAGLKPDEAVLAFSATSTQLVAYRIDAANIRAQRLELTPAEARVQVEAARKALMAGESAAPLETLARVLLTPAAPLPAGRLIVLPYGALHQLPFYALPIEGIPLVERLELTLFPSAGLVRHGQEMKVEGKETRATLPALVIGDATRDLQSTQGEARTVAGLFAHPTLLMGDDATRERVLSELKQAKVFHFAGHGRLEGRSTVGPSLVLAQARHLTSRDLLTRALPAPLVVLSGCETGGGTLMGGGDFQGLTAGFLGAGSRAVVATFWPLEQGDALPLMKHFYARWLSGETSAAGALKQAIQAARAGQLGARQAQPRVWAAFGAWGGE